MAARAMIDLGHGRAARGVAILAAAAVALSLGAAIYYGHVQERPGFVRMPETKPVAYRDLVFTDGRDGSVAVSDAKDGRQIAAYRAGEGSFIRVALRGLAQERRRAGIGEEGPPFRLARQADGKLTLEDLATHRLIVIDAFGATQAGAFQKLLP